MCHILTFHGFKSIKNEHFYSLTDGIYKQLQILNIEQILKQIQISSGSMEIALIHLTHAMVDKLQTGNSQKVLNLPNLLMEQHSKIFRNSFNLAGLSIEFESGLLLTILTNTGQAAICNKQLQLLKRFHNAKAEKINCMYLLLKSIQHSWDILHTSQY